MTYRSLLVHIDNTDSTQHRIAVATDLANRFDASVIGLYVKVQPNWPSYALGAGIPAEVIAHQEKYAQEQAEEAKARFGPAIERAVNHSEFRIETALDQSLARTIAIHSRHADLTVMGQVDPDDPKRTALAPEDVLLESGRPGLIIPYIGPARTFGEKVMVAWDGGREATRTIFDAMPILTAAKEVSLVCINPQSLEDVGEQPGADIAAYMASHGVSVNVEVVVARGIDVGDALLSHISDCGADCAVMGAYGKSRLREYILGGATRNILHHMTVPVIMSH